MLCHWCRYIFPFYFQYVLLQKINLVTKIKRVNPEINLCNTIIKMLDFIREKLMLSLWCSVLWYCTMTVCDYILFHYFFFLILIISLLQKCGAYTWEEYIQRLTKCIYNYFFNINGNICFAWYWGPQAYIVREQ